MLACADGHPESIICNDPRFKEGGRMMNSYVTANEYSQDIYITTNVTQYKYGEAVQITVKANGTKFVKDRDAPLGVYLAIQVEFTGPDGEAMGDFHDLSSDLNKTANCASSVFSITDKGPFNGKTTVSWTPTYTNSGFSSDSYLKTTGNATFKLLWSNGVASSDPLSEYLLTPNPYLFMKKVTIWDPTKWNPGSEDPAPKPSPVPKTHACVDTTAPKGHTFKNSPVFVQHIEGGQQTFATNRCLGCRFDQQHVCRSAKVFVS